MASSSMFLASPILSGPTQKRSLSLPSATSVRSSISVFPRSFSRPPPISRTLSAVAAIQVDHQDSVKPSAQSSSPPPALPFRIGHGFDLHRLEPGLPLIIGGINIPHDRGCEAHSDGDVLLHCVVDAILGALGLPDIGQIFPDSDPKWKGAASSVFVREAIKCQNINLLELERTLDGLKVISSYPKLKRQPEGMNFSLKVIPKPKFDDS
ncbi:2-C-methyl-D-erythritol 2,4-cyclodiphosphate synthase, chloroplastic isoform X2 [Elaeis guineensis]|uniref:2-C-methyl-D-erythritol 2,4-cyclodiphosphate synthase n=1 Tax=Elaeis guineensis var. tenera TaxID=51953 RepID=A0A6I9RX87_ELAGV|nr:2-C-methyl-D-erythritol 2,4-cyclodiphosphate synthase, chloroplastic isoform X2 [Elaeis guineensis]